MKPYACLGRRLWAVLSVLLVSSVAAPALADPYSFYARFKPIEKGDAVDVPVAAGDVVPREALGYVLEGIYLRLTSDAIGKVSLADVEALGVQVGCGGTDCLSREAIEGGDTVITLGANAKLPDGVKVLDASLLASAKPVHLLNLRVRARLSQAFVCRKESDFREAKGKPVPDYQNVLPHLLTFLQPAAPAASSDVKPNNKPNNKPNAKAEPPAAAASLALSALSPSDLAFFSQRAAHGLFEGSAEPLMFSFCKGENDRVQWDQLLADRVRAGQKDATIDSVMANQRERLAGLLQGALKADLGVSDIDVSDKGLAVPATYQAFLVKDLASQISFIEIEGRGARALEGVVDHDSRFAMSIKPDVCAILPKGCESFVNGHLTLAIEGADGKAKKSMPLVATGDRFELGTNLKEYLGTTVTLVVTYRQGDKTLELHRRSVDVENLGLVTSFPVVSEVLAAYQNTEGDGRANLQDPELKSSGTVSWAYNSSAGDARHMALTFPFMMGYNFRSAPRLADYVRVFPHVSVVFPLNDNATGADTPDPKSDLEKANRGQLVLGVGVNFMKAFSLSWGMATDTGAAYTLIGVSPTDLARLP